jgi:hypothetical protein
MPDLSSLLGGAGGGMPDIGAMMSNPMVQGMVNNMMSNPAMMQNMMASMGKMMGGGGTCVRLRACVSGPACVLRVCACVHACVRACCC